ncbi:flagella synthesis protein FlgN [Chitinilyticum litopenaei]|uniref:flagella synthesis protein FlgN n=1 Tax=Chitinilyticum litopenaei TaxID=1121276 RepID=UPI000415BA27|nr:flagellar protein FlgN [Chitinilyticum litopenaei]
MSDIAAAIRAEQQQLAALYQTLQEEQQLLAERQLDKLSVLLEEKTRQIRTLEQLSQQRRQALSAAGVTDQAEPIRSWLDTYQPDLLPAWDELLELARKAELLNRSNGQLINTRMDIEQSFLRQFVQQHELDAGGYSADGRLSTGGGASRKRDLA